MQDDDIVPLRGHHLLCLLGYRGLGYSPAFVQNMTRVFRRLQGDEATRVRLSCAPASLCTPCPHRGPLGCQARGEGSEGRVRARDEAVLARLALREGQVLPWREAKGRIAQLLRPQELRELCQGCAWLPYGYCVQGLERLVAASAP